MNLTSIHLTIPAPHGRLKVLIINAHKIDKVGASRARIYNSMGIPKGFFAIGAAHCLQHALRGLPVRCGLGQPHWSRPE